jgi:hypothetical protein
MRLIYEKTKFVNNCDYIIVLRIDDILNENYEIPSLKDSEKQ